MQGRRAPEAPRIIIILRWSKTRQRGDSAHLVPLPARPGHPLCPLAARQDILRHSPTVSPNDTLLQVPAPPHAPTRQKCVPIPRLAKGLRTVLIAAGLSPSEYSLHSLRAGGATDAHRRGAAPTEIQRHGDWTSQCFRGYVAASPATSAPIPPANQPHFWLSLSCHDFGISTRTFRAHHIGY